MEAVAVTMRRDNLDYLTGVPLRRYLDADITFHMVIVRGLNNRRCMKIISEFRVIQRIFEYHRVVHTARLVEQAREQHAQILAAIRHAEAETAGAAMIDHIRCCREYALRACERSETTAESAPVELPGDLQEQLTMPTVE
jgi:DNA-binding GntR family transcriptional regulator